MNICGCLVHAAPDMVTSVKDATEAMNGAEVHAQSEDGRLVVVVEDTEDQRASDIIMSMHQIPGVISVTLTYHHFEDAQQDGARQPEPAASSSHL